MVEPLPVKDRHPRLKVDLFCEVIDNYGDAGVCWRLARQLVSEWHFHVRLWIDRLSILQKICPDIQLDRFLQTVSGVDVAVWQSDAFSINADQIPDVVIEGFGTRLPDSYVEQMSAKTVAPVWLNLEYLSAESWVETTHLMQSPHSRFPLMKHFFFPGFTEKTGGLIRERELLDEAMSFQSDRGNAIQYLSSLGIPCSKDQFIVSLFCYPTAPVLRLLNQLTHDRQDVLCLIPDGVAVDAIGQFMGKMPDVGGRFNQGSLNIQIVPIIEQTEYDRFLWSCDLNFVRGEDSFVRAQWASKPFVWQIYPQEDDAHVEKLNAFMALYLQGLDQEGRTVLQDFWCHWNTCSTSDHFPESWQRFREILPNLKQHGDVWRKKLAEQPDLSAALVRFIDALR